MSFSQKHHRDLRTWFIEVVTLIALGIPLARELYAQETPAVPSTVPASEQKPAQPITEAEATQFAHLVSDLIRNGDIEACEKLFDWISTVDKITELPAGARFESVRKAFRNECLVSLKEEGNLARAFVSEVKGGGAYKVIRVNVKEPEPYVFFRLTSAAGGLNYHHVFLRRRADGSIVAVDLLNFLTNERMSDTWRRAWTAAASEAKRSQFERLILPRDPLLSGGEDMVKFTKLVQEKKFTEALAVYRKMPEANRKEKNVLAMRLGAALNISPDEYRQAIEDCRKYQSKDFGFDFILITAYASQKQFEKALECLDRTSANTGGDSFLSLQRALLLMALQRLPEAKKAVDDAILGEPDLSAAYWVALKISLAEQKFDDTVRNLKVLESQHGYRWDDFQQIPEYSEFTKSSQYRKWMQDAPSVSTTVQEAGDQSSKPITEAEAIQFADNLSAAIRKSNLPACSKLFDFSSTLDKVTEVPFAPNLEAQRKNYCKGFLAEATGEGSFANLLLAEVKSGGTFKCTRIDVKGPEPYAMFRLNFASAGYNFQHLFLKRKPDGSIVVTDVYNFVTNERASSIWHRSWTEFALPAMRTPFEKMLFPFEQQLSENEELRKGFFKLIHEKKFVEALAFYRKLPEALRKEKNILGLRLRAAMNVSVDEYTQGVDDCREYYPNDFSFDLLMVTAYASQMQYDKALECLARANKNVGGDSMLLTESALLLMTMGRLPEAKKTVDEAILGEPDLKDAYAVALNVSLAEQNFDDTVRCLDILEKEFRYRWADLREVPEYSEFVKSPQYLNWMKTRAEK